MKAYLKIFTLIVTGALLGTSCTKWSKACLGSTELTGKEHLVDISVLSQAPELLDTLAKYPQLQVARIKNDPYAIGMHCNVFYQDLQVFSDEYILFKQKSNNHLEALQSYILDQVQVSLIPHLSHDEAISIAKKTMDFSESCIYYRLGLFNLNSGTGETNREDRLVWKVQGKDGWPYVILDAQDGTVYRSFDGIILD